MSASEHASRSGPFDRFCRDDDHRTRVPEPTLRITARRDLTIINLRGNPGSTEFLLASKEQIGAELPLKANSSVATRDGVVLNLGPDEWLLIGAAFHENLPIDAGFLTDVSHGRSALRIQGAGIRTLLAKGCSVDLHARAFKPGDCIQTSIARVSVLLHLLESGEEVDLYCARSYAGTLWHWLTEAAAEFGYRTEVSPNESS